MENKEKVATYIRGSRNEENSQLDNMLQSVKDGDVDCVIVKSRTRLSDDPQECETIVKKIVEYGAELYETEPNEKTGEAS